jgi:hypothetical protein
LMMGWTVFMFTSQRPSSSSMAWMLLLFSMGCVLLCGEAGADSAYYSINLTGIASGTGVWTGWSQR